jgi:uncharacterized protein YgiM (DUF1202 family)
MNPNKALHHIIVAILFISAIVVSALTPVNVLAQTVSPTATPTPTPAPSVTLVGTVTTGTLNARSGPGLSYPVVAKFLPGELVSLTGRTSNSAWLRLASTQFPDLWANVQFIQTSSPTSALPIVTNLSDGSRIAVSATINAPRLNVRQGPWVSYDVVTTANPTDVVGIIGKNAAGTWANIRLTNNKTGWANITLLQPERSWARLVNELPITSKARLTLDGTATVSKPITVTVDSFPQYVPITVTVSSPLSSVACRVATGGSGYHGVKTLAFAMPSECPSGTLLSGTTISVTVTTGDPLYTVSGNVVVNK